jgi:hypothetical protein
LRKAFTRKRPYRCRSCGWRGWGVDSGPSFADAERRNAERAIAPEPPDLRASDVRPEERRGDVDLAALDAPSRSTTRDDEPSG